MKKLFLSILIGAVATTSIQAQVIPERKHDGYRPQQQQQQMRQKWGMAFHQLNLSDAQKEQFKTQNQEFKKKMEELKKNEDITVKEWKSRMESLRKDHKSKMESILTTEQKAQIEKMKNEGKARQEEKMKVKAYQMKIHYGLTDEQSARMEKSHKEMAEKMKALRENKSLSDEKKREEIKELMKKQQENTKSILTEEQLQKMKEERKHRQGPGMKGQKPPKEEII
jgi:Spy/CpxP family protein refolding chaperone